VPSVFNWTTDPSASALARKERAKRRKVLSAQRLECPTEPVTDMEKINKSGECETSHAPGIFDCVEVEVSEPTEETVHCVDSKVSEPTEETVHCVDFEVSEPTEETAHCVDSEVIQSAEDTVQDSAVHIENTSKCESGSEGCSGDKQRPRSAGVFRAKDFKKRDKDLHYYTGLLNYEHLQMILNILGDSVNNLIYYTKGGMEGKSKRILEPEDELFLTLMKLRKNFDYHDLSVRFGISLSSVSNIFITWINLLYCVFKEINIWPMRSSVVNYEKFKGNSETPSTVIIDCTEFGIEKPSNPIAQQVTWSSYKNRNTVKVLVGINESGAVIFISEAYGGSVSDRELFEKCGIIDRLRSGDVILCDRGFLIQDLVAHIDVKVNMPAFLKKGVTHKGTTRGRTQIFQ